MSAFVLHELQIVDSQIDHLQQQKQSLPEKSAYDEAKSFYEQASQKEQQLKQELDAKRHEQKKLEDEAAILNQKLTREENRLYGGQVTNVKELQALEEEVKALKSKKEAMESKLLELMEEVDSLSQHELVLIEEVQAKRAKLDLAQAKYEETVAAINKQLLDLKSQREQLLQTVSPQDLKLYEHLRQEKKGVAVVKLDGSTCEGCHLELPASDVDRIYSEQYWRCPHCRRIVVRRE